MYNGACQSSCPDGYFADGHTLTESSPGSLLSYICLPCHYSCKTCSGPAAYECLTCHGDSVLGSSIDNQTPNVLRYCYTANFLDYISNTDMWYKLLIVSLIVNVIAICSLIYYICSRKCSRGVVGNSGNSQRSFERNSQPYTRLSPEDTPPSGDEFENIVVDSDNEEISANYSTKKTISESNSNYRSNIQRFNLPLSSSRSSPVPMELESFAVEGKSSVDA